MVLVIKNPPTNAGDLRDTGSFPGWGRSPAQGHGNALQYSCLENPVDRGAWPAMVHRVAKSRTQLKQLSTGQHTPRTVSGLPWWLRQQRICVQCRRLRFSLWDGKIPWRRDWLTTPAFLPREFHGKRSLVGTVHGVTKSRTQLSN